MSVCLSHFSIDHEFHSRRSTVPIPSRDTFNTWASIISLPCVIVNTFYLYCAGCKPCGASLSDRRPSHPCTAERVGGGLGKVVFHIGDKPLHN